MTDKLTSLRETIDAIDAHILELISRRGKVAQEVGRVKAETGAPVFRPEREAQVLRGAARHNAGPLPDRDVHTIFREIMSSCRALEKRVTVACFGPAGVQAMLRHFGSAVNALPCVSVDDVFRAAADGTADFGIVPIEHASEGAVGRVLDLMLDTTCVISGEIAVPVLYGEEPDVPQTPVPDDPHARTRFVVIGRQAASPSGIDRTSLVLAVPNQAGAVYDLLSPLVQHGVSMTRFESRAARSGTRKYYFYVDIEGHVADPAVAAALDALQRKAAFFKLLGSYPASV
nr:chorismate mutase [uncultured Massilia sp.]